MLYKFILDIYTISLIPEQSNPHSGLIEVYRFGLIPLSRKECYSSSRKICPNHDACALPDIDIILLLITALVPVTVNIYGG